MKAFLSAICLLVTFSAPAFSDRDVLVANPEAGIVLAGTLSVPDGAGPKAALVLASGSGKQNRDEEVAGHRPFKTIAEYLSERGYAVLRLDDRGAGQSGGVFENSDADDFVSDIAAGVAYVDSLFPAVPCGVLGHSEGGAIAYRLAAQNPRVGFIVTLAAPAWPGDSLIMSQSRALATALTGQWEQEALQRRLLDIAAGPLPSSIALPILVQTVAESLPSEARTMPEVQSQLVEKVSPLLTTHYRKMLRYDPTDDIRSVAVPWLALNGDKDMQVLVGNLQTIAALNPAAATVVLSDHNHLFQQCVSGLPGEYVMLPEDISEETLSRIALWLDGLLP